MLLKKKELTLIKYNFTKLFSQNLILIFINVLRLIAISLISSIIIVVPLDVYFINSFDFSLNKLIVLRVLFLFFTIIQIVFYKLLVYKKENINLNNLNYLDLTFSIIIFIIALVGYQQLFYGHLSSSEYYLIAIVLFGYLFYLVSPIDISRNTKKTFTTIFLILALFLSFNNKIYLNSESFVDLDLILMNDEVKETHKELNKSLNIKLDDSSKDLYNKNYSKFRYISNEVFYQSDFNNEKNIFYLKGNKFSISDLCFFLKNPENSKLLECVTKLRNTPVSSGIDYLRYFLNDNDLEIHEIIYLNFEKIILFLEFQIKKPDEVLKKNLLHYLSVSSVKGAYMHHYNAIGHSVNSDLLDLSQNQYGFGPLLAVKVFKKLFNLTTFDAIYIATQFFNLLLFLIIVIFFRFGQLNLFVGFSLTIFGTYAFSQFMAPFLYPIRFFPIIILCLLVYKFSQIKSNMSSDSLYKIFFISLVITSSIYNFEYGILLSASLISTGLFLKNKFYFFNGFLGFVISFLPRLVSKNTEILINYPAYFAGLGRTDNLSVLMYLFFVAFVLISIHLILNQKKINEKIIVIYFISLFLLFKVVWIGSFNHIAALFFILALLYDPLKNTILAKSNKINFNPQFKKYTNPFIQLLILLVFFFGVINLLKMNFSHQNDLVTYVKNPNISSMFSMDIHYSNKLNNFASIYQNKDIVISPIDNALSLRVENNVTNPYPDLSTNINGYHDIFRIVKYFESTKPNFIFDKVLNGDPKKQVDTQILTDYISINLEDYYRNLSSLKKIANYFLLNTNYRKCDENEDFIKYCFIENLTK